MENSKQTLTIKKYYEYSLKRISIDLSWKFKKSVEGYKRNEN